MVASGFVGRIQELTQLREFMAQPESGLAVIYGRRRVGKTRLIAELLEATPVLSFEGLEERPTRDQINHFLFQLQPYVESLKFRGKRPSTWKEALLLLLQALKASPRPVVLDEFQWMANYRHELVSDLKYVWENFLAKVPGQKLILCGSIASFMLEKVINSRALYGRVDVRLSLPGFRLRESQELLADKGEAEVLEAHLLTGGIPKYLKLLGEGPSVQLAIQKHAFTPNSYFVTEYRSIFASHFGKNPDFQNIVRALAAHPLGLSREQLIEKAKLDSGGYLTEQLRDLESVGFIRAAAPIHKAAKGVQVKYFLIDAYLRFYFDFLLPNLNKIQSGRENLFAHIAQSGAFHAWMGRAFEYTCIQHAHLISTLLGFSGIDYTVGPYFVPSRKGELQGVQIDLVFDRPDNVMTACEIKYGSRPAGVEVIPEMERKVQLLEAVAGRKTIHKVLIVKEPVSQELARRMYFYRIIRADELFQ
jgi:uncharacterized protein